MHRTIIILSVVLSLLLVSCSSEKSTSTTTKSDEVVGSKKLYNGRTLSQWFQEIESTEFKENKVFWLDAEKAISQLGPENSDEIPYLVYELRQKAIRPRGALHCQIALTNIGAAASGPVSELLKSSIVELRLLAIEVLKRMGRDAAGAIENLEAAYNDSNEVVRSSSRKLLFKLCRDHQPAQEAFIRVLKDGPPDQKLYVSKRLAKLKVKSAKLAEIASKELNSASPELKKILMTILETNRND